MRRIGWAVLTLPFVLANCVTVVQALTPAPRGLQAFRATSLLVTIDALVRDRRTGIRVNGLTDQDFEVLDNGQPVQIAYFSRGDDRQRPFALALFVEVDNSIHPILPNLESRLDRALRHLLPRDHVAVFVFDPYNFSLLQDLTPDRDGVLNALDMAAALRNHRGNVSRFKKFEALPNALVAWADDLSEQEPRARSAAVVIGSDFDVISGRLVDDVSKRLLTAGTTVGGLIKSDAQASAAKVMMRALTLPSFGSARADDVAYFSRRTGGESIEVRSDDYGDALERLIGDLAQRYTLGFAPSASQLDGTFHKITVRVRPSAAQGKGRYVRVLARSGYIATP